MIRSGLPPDVEIECRDMLSGLLVPDWLQLNHCCGIGRYMRKRDRIHRFYYLVEVPPRFLCRWHDAARSMDLRETAAIDNPLLPEEAVGVIGKRGPSSGTGEG